MTSRTTTANRGGSTSRGSSTCWFQEGRLSVDTRKQLANAAVDKTTGCVVLHGKPLKWETLICLPKARTTPRGESRTAAPERRASSSQTNTNLHQVPPPPSLGGPEAPTRAHTESQTAAGVGSDETAEADATVLRSLADLAPREMQPMSLVTALARPLLLGRPWVNSTRRASSLMIRRSLTRPQVRRRNAYRL